ncbi:MAG: hypothetical protein ACT6SB_16865, partial [Aeromicrobium sp.]|uniref:hypothetical protein n=1 Tax=Aeromicrobium sp. TaxID=1871063 RepID=UPI0040345B9E
MEVYDRLWVELGRPLRAMLREALADTADPAPLAEFLTGIIALGHLTDSFPLASGLLQGSGASPLYWCIVLQPLVSYLSSPQLAGRISTPTIPSSPLAMHRAALTPALPSKEYADDLTIVVLDRVRDGKVV